jgi:ribosomal subunit interface protein
MQMPLQIAFRNLERSEAAAAKIVEHAAKLETYYDRIIGCRVMVELQHRHHHRGNHYHVRVDVTVPGKELVANPEPDEHAYADVYVAIRDAFDTMRRQLEDHTRERRGDVKAHETPPHGTIAEIHPADDYGRIDAPGIGLVSFIVTA